MPTRDAGRRSTTPRKKDPLGRARDRGCLWLGSRPARRLQEEWALWCRETGRDMLTVRRDGPRALVQGEIHPSRPLTGPGLRELEALLDAAGVGDWTGRTFRMVVPAPEARRTVARVQELLGRDRSVGRQREAESQRAGLREGLARCLDPRGYETVLQAGDEVYVREMAGLPGRGVVLTHLGQPLLAVPLDRFRFTAEGEGA